MIKVVVGLQWGDEGKGKITDYLCSQADGEVADVRFQGGGNAGHTIYKENKKFVLHHVPSGIINPDVKYNICGHNMVIDQDTFCKELQELQESNENTTSLLISSRAHIVTPYHRALEQLRGTSSKIGTTKRGIGPAYTDRAARSGIRFADLKNNPEWAKNQMRENVMLYNILADTLGHPILNAEEIIKKEFKLYETLKQYVVDLHQIIHGPDGFLRTGVTMIAEGAQGTMLDLTHGNYPNVTSSQTIAAAAAEGLGVDPRAIDEVIGVAKAYTTKVGNGPFPTELTDDIGARLQKTGHEFGSTTERPRRCGWLDLVQLQYAAELNGLDKIILTKMDVLNGMPEVKICTAYTRENKRTDRMPDRLEECTPLEYEIFEGWTIEGDEVPNNAHKFLDFISERLGVRITHISTGPKKDQLIKLQ